MARYFLHIVKLDGSRIEDPEGSDLPDLAAARREALGGARDILASVIKAGRDLADEAILITDEEGREVDLVPFSDAVPQSLRERLR